MDLPIFYVRDRAPAAHIWDYLQNRSDHALCGHGYVHPSDLGEVTRPRSVCRGCQALAPKAEAMRWRQLAEETTAELTESLTAYDNLWREYEKLWTAYQQSVTHAENQRREIRGLQTRQSTKNSTKKGTNPRKAQATRSPLGVDLPRVPSSGKRPRVKLFG